MRGSQCVSETLVSLGPTCPSVYTLGLSTSTSVRSHPGSSGSCSGYTQEETPFFRPRSLPMTKKTVTLLTGPGS